MKNLASYKLALYVICIVAMLFIATVGEAFAQGPVYNPPGYSPVTPSLRYDLSYGYDRMNYDLNYSYQYSQYGYSQVNQYYQSYRQTGVFGRVADPNW